MKLFALFVAGALFFTATLHAEEAPAAPKIGAVAIPEILQNFTGKGVELRLKSGDKCIGTVAAVGANTVHISQLMGAEFYDAVVSLDSIAAVVVRTKKN